MRRFDMKGQPNWDSNPEPPSQGSNHATYRLSQRGWLSFFQSVDKLNQIGIANDKHENTDEKLVISIIPTNIKILSN